MPEQVRILASRRAYEFRPESLRLTMLLAPMIAQQIQATLGFHNAAIGTPLETFGPIAPTFPPGFVFNNGVYSRPDGQMVPIRFLHFEPTRIVCDIAGPSEGLDHVFQTLRTIFGSTTAADGTPIMEEAERVLDYSEVTSVLSFGVEQILPPGWHALISETLASGAPLLPTLYLRGYASHQPSERLTSLADHHAWRLEIRPETPPGEREYRSSAPLPSDAHIAFLQRLEETLESRVAM